MVALRKVYTGQVAFWTPFLYQNKSYSCSAWYVTGNHGRVGDYSPGSAISVICE